MARRQNLPPFQHGTPPPGHIGEDQLLATVVKACGARGLRQRDIADALGITQSAVSQAFGGRASTRTLVAMAALAGVKVSGPFFAVEDLAGPDPELAAAIAAGDVGTAA